MSNSAQPNVVSRLTALSGFIRSPKYTIRGRTGFGAVNPSPYATGPGSYNIPSSFRSKSSVSTSNLFGSSSRTSVCVAFHFSAAFAT